MCADAVTSTYKNKTAGEECSLHTQKDLILNLQHLHGNLGGVAKKDASSPRTSKGRDRSVTEFCWLSGQWDLVSRETGKDERAGQSGASSDLCTYMHRCLDLYTHVYIHYTRTHHRHTLMKEKIMSLYNISYIYQDHVCICVYVCMYMHVYICMYELPFLLLWWTILTRAAYWSRSLFWLTVEDTVQPGREGMAAGTGSR